MADVLSDFKDDIEITFCIFIHLQFGICGGKSLTIPMALEMLNEMRDVSDVILVTSYWCRPDAGDSKAAAPGEEPSLSL